MAFVPGGTSDWPDARVPRDQDQSATPWSRRSSTRTRSPKRWRPRPTPVTGFSCSSSRGIPLTPPELLAEARYSDPSSLRLRIFEADVLRVSNRLDRAVELFRQLLAETHGTPDEAVIRQHLGRSYFASGNTAAAVESFTKALDLRVAGSADAALIYASTVAVRRARDVLERTS